jgi:lysozyme
LGIDVSSHQHLDSVPIEWSRVADQGVAFAFVKATEGTFYRNPFFAADWDSSKAAGLYRGAYHFADPDHSNPRDEADFFLNSIGTLSEGDLVALDLEQGSGVLLDWAKEWLDYVHQQLVFRPLLYGGYHLEVSGCTGDPQLAEYGLWYARYQSRWPATPPAWSFIAFWQYSDAGSIEGVPSTVDLDFFNSSVDRIPLYGLQPANAARSSDLRVGHVPVHAYVTRLDDTLVEIAAATGQPVVNLQKINSGLDALRPGTVLTLGSSRRDNLTKCETYVTRGARSLDSIANRLKVSLLSLETANPEYRVLTHVPEGAPIVILNLQSFTKDEVRAPHTQTRNDAHARKASRPLRL